MVTKKELYQRVRAKTEAAARKLFFKLKLLGRLEGMNAYDYPPRRRVEGKRLIGYSSGDVETEPDLKLINEERARALGTKSQVNAKRVRLSLIKLRQWMQSKTAAKKRFDADWKRKTKPRKVRYK